MRRLVLSVAGVLSLVVATTGPVAAKPDKVCPPAPSAFTVFAIDAIPGDGLPAPGENALWDQTLAGIAAEGLTPEQLAAELGLSSREQLFESIMQALRDRVDRNDDNLFCAKPFPDTGRGQLAYFFNAVDNNARRR